MHKYSRCGGGQRIKQRLLLSSFSCVYLGFPHLSLWVSTICLVWYGFIICNGSSVGFLRYFCAVEPTHQALCTFCLAPGLKPASHNNLNNRWPLENRIISDKIKATIFSITILLHYRGCPGAQAAVRTVLQSWRLGMPPPSSLVLSWTKDLCKTR